MARTTVPPSAAAIADALEPDLPHRLPLAGDQRFLPAGGTKAPLITGSQTGKTEFRAWC